MPKSLTSQVAMHRIPDLVRDSQLDTRFHSKYTSHVYYESGPTARERVLVREEYWKREKYIGGGSFGTVWLEKCVKGQREVEVRAVKEIPKPQQPSRPVNYNRELEAMAKFSHWKVSSLVRTWYALFSKLLTPASTNDVS